MTTPVTGMNGPESNPSMVPMIAYVRRHRKETQDTFTLEFAIDHQMDFRFLPGQFNMLYVYGVGEVPISISGDPSCGNLLMHTTREVGTVTRAMRRLKVSDPIGIRGPFGIPWPIHEAVGHDVVIVAGGIGLAPLRPVMYHIIENRDKYNRVVLLYGARRPEDILFRKEISKWSARLDIDVHVTVDRATRRWHGNVGVITTLIPRAPFTPVDAIAMVCGPELMMHFAVQELDRRGVAPDRIYISMERNMKCAVGLCGHCQLGPHFVCKDGPVFRFDDITEFFSVREL